MSWHVGPPRETDSRSSLWAAKWYRIIEQEVADNKARWRVDNYVAHVVAPVEIADTFLDEWLVGLWQTHET
jgi:hypothetical protein